MSTHAIFAKDTPRNTHCVVAGMAQASKYGKVNSEDIEEASPTEHAAPTGRETHKHTHTQARSIPLWLKVCGSVLLCAAAVTWAVTVEKRFLAVRRDACKMAQALLSTSEAPDVPKSAEYAKCRHVFVDGGSNRGDTAMAFSGDQPNHEIGEAREAYLKRINKTVHDVCYFGFEGNRKWTSKLREVQAKYADRFAHIEFFTETVLLSRPANVSFWVENRTFAEGSKVDWDPRLRYWAGRKTVVRGVDLAAFIAQFSLDSLYLKLDIEGSEYVVLRRLLATGQLCKPRKPIHLSIEFHLPDAPAELIEHPLLDVLKCCGVVTNVFA
uniref:Methyltransferase FkbM domain-containing protein n=1 Tax=Alexandrium monilatum TaxID=311494 RepID=A0A7S4R001_9DINO